MSSDERSALSAFFLGVGWWIGVALLFFLLSWSTSSLENRALIRSIDAAFEAAGDNRRVGSALSAQGADGPAALKGKRFSLNAKGETAVVFSVNGAGASATFVAVNSAGKGVVSVLLLDQNSASAADRLPAGLLEAKLKSLAVSENLAAKKKAKK